MEGLERIKAIAFDADDTLWVNETLFRDTEDRFCDWVSAYLPPEEARARLEAVEERNMAAYGYGIKPFTLSLVEAALEISRGQLPPETIQAIIDNGKRMLEAPVENLPGVPEVLRRLNGHYRLVVATKGDLHDQENKLARSGIAHHFAHVEVLSDKTVERYRALLERYDAPPDRFLMVGNSPRSDILPVLDLGARAVQVPYEVTWAHEHHEGEAHWPVLASIRDVVAYATGVPPGAERRERNAAMASGPSS